MNEEEYQELLKEHPEMKEFIKNMTKSLVVALQPLYDVLNVVLQPISDLLEMDDEKIREIGYERIKKLLEE